MSSDEIGDVKGVGVVGDVHVLAGFTGNSTRMGGVAVESTCTAV